MALATECQTPGAIYSIHIGDKVVEIVVDLGIDLDLNETQAESLEARLHNAVEQVLAQYYTS